MQKPAKQQGIDTKIYNIEQDIKKKFNKELQEGFMKILQRGKFILEECKCNAICSYIKEEYNSEIIENVNRIWKNEGLTKDMQYKLNTWNKENRTAKRLLLDVVSAWLTQDYVANLITQMPKYNEYSVEFGGGDAERLIKKASECTRETDIILVHKKTGEKVYVEVMEDNTGYVKRTGTFDLRWSEYGNSNKYQDLIDLSKINNGNVFVVILDIANDGLIFVPVTETEVLIYQYPNPRWDDRMCTKLKTDYAKNFISFNQEEEVA